MQYLEIYLKREPIVLADLLFGLIWNTVIGNKSGVTPFCNKATDRLLWNIFVNQDMHLLRLMPINKGNNKLPLYLNK